MITKTLWILKIMYQCGTTQEIYSADKHALMAYQAELHRRGIRSIIIKGCGTIGRKGE